MSKKDTPNSTDDFEYITTELERMHPEEGDVFILNVNTDNPEILSSDEIMDNVEMLSEALYEFTGKNIPILVFGNELDLSLVNKQDLLDILEKLEDLEDKKQDEAKPEEVVDTEHLTDIFN